MSKKKEKESENSLSNRDIVLAGLQRYGRYQKQAGAWRMVICPFHKNGQENTPSCGVRVTDEGLGIFNCLGCEEKGGWNKFAEKTGLEPIKAWNNSESINVNLVSKELDSNLLGDAGLTFKQVKKIMNCEEAILWPSRLDWRGFPGWFMESVGAHIVNDQFNDSVAALLPVKVAGKVRGAIKASYEKSKKKGSSSYYTMKGEWVRDYGLFPYIYAKKLIRKNKYKFICVTEGPRDALRLCLNGIPAVCVLGAKNVTKKKIMFLTSLDIDTIYVIPDNDSGGTLMWKQMKNFSPKNFPLKRVKLPTPRDEKGELIKIDPASMSKKLLKRFMRYLVEENKFVFPETVY